jgi:actinin alpha
LEELAAKKKIVLDAALQRELLKEELRLSFANTARDFGRFVTETVQDCKEAEFGFTLSEVQKFKETLTKQEKDHTVHAEGSKKEYEKVHAELTQLGVIQNVYTSQTPQTLHQHEADLRTALKERSGVYEKELKRQLDNDNLCREFAQTAEKMSERLKKTRESIIISTRNHEDQLKDVQRAIELHKKSEELTQAKEWQAKITAAGIANNPHTSLSVIDLEVAAQQYELFLTTKQEVLEKEIEHQKLRGITPQEYGTIERQFKTFDRDGNKLLDRSEFKACLYSLGNDLGKKEIQDILDKYGGKKNCEAITYEQFKEWMIDFYGVVDSKADISHAFHLISFDEKSIRWIDFVPRRIPVITLEDLAFFKTTAPKTANKTETWDYPPWVEEVFSR